MDKKREVEDLIAYIEKKFNSIYGKNKKESYEPYIRTIRFPKYKKLDPNSEINFTFPLTVLVGENGCNKTSVLQAIYGVPENQSVSKYWFSTEVDKIKDIQTDPSCFVYSYFHKGAKKCVEYVKKRSGQAKGADYWESDRPLPKYGMAKITKQELKSANNRSTTRWDPIIKKTVFCDFKEYVSAFDICFYHANIADAKSYKTPQDFIRYKSRMLSKAVEKNLESWIFYNNERIIRNESLSDDKVKVVSEIMGQEYEEIRIIEHSLYTSVNELKPHKTIIIKKKELQYTEAFAGSGESRIILMVDEVLNAEAKSLILLDEPEINLHPGAQIRLKRFLLEQILEKEHQIVLTTHSHYLIDKLPKKAIKLLKNTAGTISIVEDVECEDAFLELGEDVSGDIKIYVEDKVSREIVKFGIEKFPVNSIKNKVKTKVLPGGVQNIIKYHIYSAALRRDNKAFFILDGDQNFIENCDIDPKYNEWIQDGKFNIDKIPKSGNKLLDDIILKFTGCNIKFNIDSNVKDEQIFDVKRQFIDFWRTNVYFLNSKTPEEAILESKGEDFSKFKNGKSFYEDKMIKEFNDENINAQTIHMGIVRDIRNLPDDCPLRNRVQEILNCIWSREKKFNNGKS